MTLPVEWPRIKLGYLVREAGGATPSKANPDFWDGEIPWVSPKDMKVDEIGDSQDHVTEAAVRQSSLRVIPVGSILMVVRGMILAHSVPVAETTRPVTLNQDMKALLPSSRIIPRFLRYTMKAAQRDLLGLVEVAGHGTCCLRSEQWRKYEIGVPSLPTQRAIADFLDRKTAALDALIEKKARLIELLAERRAALIHRAVTQGLDPAVPFKDSGIAWIGEIPAHWDAVRLGFLASVGNGSTPKRDNSDYWSGDGYPWLHSGKINDGVVIEADRFVTELALKECHLPRLSSGTVLVAITGEGQTRGRSALLAIDATISQHLAYISLGSQSMTPRFLCWLLSAYYAWLRHESSGGGSTKGAITCGFLRSVPVLVPPLAEQESIAQYCQREGARLDRIEAATRQQVAKLKEYRQALITAAVTGQLDIPEAA